MIRRPPRSTLDRSSAASDVYKRQVLEQPFAFVYEYVIANVPTPDVAGSNEFPVTPVPLSLIHISEPTRPY